MFQTILHRIRIGNLKQMKIMYVYSFSTLDIPLFDLSVLTYEQFVCKALALREQELNLPTELALSNSILTNKVL